MSYLLLDALIESLINVRQWEMCDCHLFHKVLRLSKSFKLIYVNLFFPLVRAINY